MHEMLLTGELTPLSMSSGTQFMIKQNYLRDIAYLTKQCVNLERKFWRFLSYCIWIWKCCHDVTETSFFPIANLLFLNMIYETFAYGGEYFSSTWDALNILWFN